MATYPLLFQLPVFFGQARGLGARTMGQSLLAMTLAMMVASLTAGRLAERIGARAQVLVASTIALSGLWWFTDFAALDDPAQVIPGLMLLGAGVGFTSAPAQAAAMSAVSSTESGMAGGLLSTLRYLGGVAGTAVLSALLVDPASPAAHQRPIVVYAGALVAAMLLGLTLPGGRRGLRF
jgi:MFS family permease